jgi:hypothetical protein
MRPATITPAARANAAAPLPAFIADASLVPPGAEPDFVADPVAAPEPPAVLVTMSLCVLLCPVVLVAVEVMLLECFVADAETVLLPVLLLLIPEPEGRATPLVVTAGPVELVKAAVARAGTRRRRTVSKRMLIVLTEVWYKAIDRTKETRRG